SKNDTTVAAVDVLMKNETIVDDVQIENTSNQDDEKAVDNVVSNHGKAVDNVLLWIFVRDKMSRDVITVGSTMRIPLLYRGEYSQWRERFMNYLEEQTYGEAMINFIQNGDVNDALRYKKKAVVVTSDPLALVAEKTNVSKRKEKVVVSSDSEGSGVDDFS
nr:hypothetical protein [Tanacetum cinerariifolium]